MKITTRWTKQSGKYEVLVLEFAGCLYCAVITNSKGKNIYFTKMYTTAYESLIEVQSFLQHKKVAV